MMDEKTVEITTTFIKLDNFLKFAGVCSTGGEAKVRIKEEEFAVNGEVCTMRGKKLYPGDTIVAGGERFRVVGGTGGE